jgi:hypothetical protein
MAVTGGIARSAVVSTTKLARERRTDRCNAGEEVASVVRLLERRC